MAICFENKLQPQWLPATPLYGDAGAGEGSPGWSLSPTPFALSEAQYQDLHRFGDVLWRFVQATDFLYKESLKGRQPAWIAQWFHQGKPEGLLKFAQMNRFKNDLPRVIRPDLLITEAGWSLCELDSVPGGLGFLSALNEAYRKSGFNVIEPEASLPAAFAQMLKKQVPEKEKPVLAILLSDEAADYRAEMQWLTELLQAQGEEIYLFHPKDVDLVRDRLVFQAPDGTEKSIDLIYRFFELFDLPNIPKIEIIQYAVKKGFVRCSPPWKPHLEEKLTLALLHHPVLKKFWESQLGIEDTAWLQQWVPQSWVVDPTPLPPQGIIPGLTVEGIPVQSFESLLTLTQKSRQLVLKPSGFSPLAWGSRGVTIGHDVAGEIWEARLREAMASFGATPYVLQTFEKPQKIQWERFKNLQTRDIEPFQVRVRLCPYYFIEDSTPHLVGVLATACPADKKVIHGMKDAVLAPCQVIP